VLQPVWTVAVHGWWRHRDVG